MSLSILFTPAALSSFQDDLVYTVLDPVAVADPVTYPNFKYIGDLYIGGVLVARLKKIADPATGIGVFNIGQAVRNYCAVAFDPSPGSLLSQTLTAGTFNLAIQMHFGENYNFTDHLDIVIDSQRTFFNNYNGRLKGTTSTLIGKQDLVLSNRSGSANLLFSSASYFVPYFPTTTGIITVTIKPILLDGSLGAPFTQNFTPAVALDLLQFNISPQVINSLSVGFLNPNIHKGYQVQIGATSIFTINLICESQYTPYMVHFLNQFGGFESYMFTKVSRTSYDVEKTGYERLSYNISNTGVVLFKSPGGVYNENHKDYASQFTENLVLNSDLVIDADYLWLRDLMLSPMVYVEDSGFFYIVQIQETNYELKKFINDELTNLTITLQFLDDNNAQFR